MQETTKPVEQTARMAAGYIRVSTNTHEEHTTLEVAKEHCKSLADKHGWDLVKIYSDEGTSYKCFQQMIKDAEDGKIDVIVTRTISEFSRNLVDTLETVRRLHALSKPVEFLFEDECLSSLMDHFDYTMCVILKTAQEEHDKKSQAMQYSYYWRKTHGYYASAN